VRADPKGKAASLGAGKVSRREAQVMYGETLFLSDLAGVKVIIEMDSRRLDILRELAFTQDHFIRRAHLYRQRDRVTMRFLDIQAAYISALAPPRIDPVTITFPINIPAGFMDNVPVVPTAQQISNEVEDFTASSQQTCSICQDAISSDGVRLRVCRHVYHRSCIQTWFGASVRCPVCRRDIREAPAAQTSSAAIETQPPPTYQWGGESSQE